MQKQKQHASQISRLKYHSWWTSVPPQVCEICGSLYSCLHELRGGTSAKGKWGRGFTQKELKERCRGNSVFVVPKCGGGTVSVLDLFKTPGPKERR
jgi:hypothetical protein